LSRGWKKLQERLTKLIGDVALINVDAVTEAEMKEKKAMVGEKPEKKKASAALQMSMDGMY
jgi:chaperonin GroEL